MLDVFAVEIVALDPNAGPTHPLTLYYATAGFATRPAETPANTHFDGRLKQPFIGPRTLFGSGTTKGRSTTGYGDVELNNGDGLLDALADYAVDGQSITIRHGTVGAAYPASFVTVLVATMAGVEVTQEVVRIKLRDRQAELNKPLQPTKYAGSNVLPAGLEGVEDLKGKPKPVCYGKVLNVPAVCVNTSKLIYQVNDGAIASIDGVYDRGITLAALDEWTDRDVKFVSGGGPEFVRNIIWAEALGLFIAVGDGGELSTSPDGLTWTARTSNSVGNAGLQALAYGAGIAVAFSSWNNFSTSTDGITWTNRSSGLGATGVFAVVFANGIFLAGDAAGNVSTSTDGITWTALVAVGAFAADSIFALAFGAGLYVAVGSNGKLASSPTGATWTTRTSGVAAGTAISAILFAGNQFVGVGWNAAIIRSPDGITWTKTTTPAVGSTESITGLTYGNNYFVAGAGSAAGGIISSSDGITWTARTNGLSASVKAVGFGHHLFLASGAIDELRTTTPLGASYASLADLSDDTLAPKPGNWKTYLTGGYFRLGAPPAGLVTADVTQGATVADRTTAQIYKALLIRAGMTAPDYSAADITALDTAANYVIGFWTDQETDYGSVLDQVAGSVGASWYVDQAGVFRILQLVPASGAPVVSFTKHDLLKPLVRLQSNDQGQGLPCYKVIVRYARNYIIQPVDVAAGVTDARRAVIGKEWMEAQYTDSSVQTTHPLAIQIVDDSLLSAAADALAEATRRQALRGIARYPFELVVPWTTENEAIDLGDVIQLTHERYGLYIVGDEDTMTYSPLFTVLGISPDAAQRRLTLTVWGPTHLAWNRITAEGEYRVDSAGNYRIVVAA